MLGYLERMSWSCWDEWKLDLMLVSWSRWVVQSHLHKGVTNGKAVSVNVARSSGEEEHHTLSKPKQAKCPGTETAAWGCLAQGVCCGLVFRASHCFFRLLPVCKQWLPWAGKGWSNMKARTRWDLQKHNFYTCGFSQLTCSECTWFFFSIGFLAGSVSVGMDRWASIFTFCCERPVPGCVSILSVSHQ